MGDATQFFEEEWENNEENPDRVYQMIPYISRAGRRVPSFVSVSLSQEGIHFETFFFSKVYEI